ncbi:WxL domain-containing protein [Lacticaseibacillus parakribbianus]|uniref:WxL domain-containing protein n=1 Tax=Lacticaseibacillus parakribbianus TaxID=2970927 RepID=UPI0021CB3D52|nr:WxL domain-containing protein [Lacticaseibacillus parakribbianus]
MKKNVKLTALALFSTLALTGVMAANSVSADTVDPQTTPAVETGHAYVTFTRNSTTGPLNPGKPGEGETETPTNETGALTLDAIPTSLNFGTQEASATNTVINLLASTDNDRGISPAGPATTDVNDGTERVVYTQVTNLLPAEVTTVDGTKTSTPVNWNLSAQLSGFTTDTGAESLKGASIVMKSGVNQKLSDDGAAWIAPTSATLSDNIVLSAGGDAVSYASGDENGILQQVWNTKNVTLNVPTSAQTIGNSTATVTWTLTATPTHTANN